MISSCRPVAPRAARVAGKVPPSAAFTSSDPGAGTGPAEVSVTPMMIASAAAVRAALSLIVSGIVVTV